MSSPHNGLCLEAKNYGIGLVASGLDLGLVDAVTSALSCVASWPCCCLGKQCLMLTSRCLLPDNSITSYSLVLEELMLLKCNEWHLKYVIIGEAEVLQWGRGRSGALERTPLRGQGQGVPSSTRNIFSLVLYKSREWPWRRVGGGFSPPNTPVALPRVCNNYFHPVHAFCVIFLAWRRLCHSWPRASSDLFLASYSYGLVNIPTS